MTKIGTNLVNFQYKGKRTHCIVKNAGKEIIADVHVKVCADDLALQSKERGRFWAFKKAMNTLKDNVILSREERSQMWSDFRNNIRQPELV